LSLFWFVESSCGYNQALSEEELDLQEEIPLDKTQPLALKFLKEAVNGAWLQSVFTSPPLVAQSSAFHRLEYNLIGCFFGYRTPSLSKFLNSLIGLPSIENLKSKDKSHKPSWSRGLWDDVNLENLECHLKK